MWGGFTGVLDSDKAMTSSMDVYHLPTGAWEGRPTNGNPPLCASGYSSIAIGKNLYFFGGLNGDYYRNSLHCFNCSDSRGIISQTLAKTSSCYCYCAPGNFQQSQSDL